MASLVQKDFLTSPSGISIPLMPDLSSSERTAISRRQFLRAAGFAGLSGMVGGQVAQALAVETVTLPFANGERPLATFPQKRPLILLTTRPPQLETPFSIFNDGLLTPNDAFFVRYHLSQVPSAIDPDKFSLVIKGAVTSPLALS